MKRIINELEQVKKHNTLIAKPDFKQKEKNVEKRKVLGGFVPLKVEKEPLDVMLLEREECEESDIFFVFVLIVFFKIKINFNYFI